MDGHGKGSATSHSEIPTVGVGDEIDDKISNNPSDTSGESSDNLLVLKTWSQKLLPARSIDAVENAIKNASGVAASALSAAKSATNDVRTIVAEDFTSVSTNASTIAKSTASNIHKTILEIEEKADVIAEQTVGTLKASLNNIWNFTTGYGSQSLKDDSDIEAYVINPNSGDTVLNRVQAQLQALASDPNTFLQNPDESDDFDFASWDCDLSEKEGEITDLLTNSIIGQQYKDLVPLTVSKSEFWRRYFFKVHLIEIQEQRRRALKKKVAERTKLASEDDQTDWGDNEKTQQESNVTSGKLSSPNFDDNKPPNDPTTIAADKDDEAESLTSDEWEKLSCGQKTPLSDVSSSTTA